MELPLKGKVRVEREREGRGEREGRERGRRGKGGGQGGRGGREVRVEEERGREEQLSYNTGGSMRFKYATNW